MKKHVHNVLEIFNRYTRPYRDVATALSVVVFKWTINPVSRAIKNFISDVKQEKANREARRAMTSYEAVELRKMGDE